MSRQDISQIIIVVSVFIGTMLGAGFVSGQELMQFFLHYGRMGYIGVVLAGGLLFVLSYCILLYSSRYRLESYRDIFISMPFVGRIADVYMSVFTFLLVAIMLSGSGSLLSTITSQSEYIGIFAMCAMAGTVCFFGASATYSALRGIVPIAVVLLVLISIVILARSNDIQDYSIDVTSSVPWYVSAILFVSYNIIATIVILVPIGAQITKKRTILISACISSIVITVIALLCLGAMNRNIESIISQEIPMVPLAFGINILTGAVYTLVMFIAIFTTIISCLHSLCMRLSHGDIVVYRVVVIVVCACSCLIARVRFSILIGWVYSISGYIGIGIMTMIIANLVSSRIRRDGLP